MDTSINPKISVLMPVYNGADYIREAINSVLSQTFTDFELLVVNDCSKDASLDIIKSYTDPRIVIINNEVNKGLIKSLNIGLARARGTYTARLDQDDVALPSRFQEQYDFMENHPDIDLVGSWTECIDKDGKSLKVSKNPENRKVIQYELLFSNVMFHSSIFFRTKKIIANGGYSETAVHAEDYEMYSRPGKELVCTNLQKVLFKYRIHGTSITGSSVTQPTVHATALATAFRNINAYTSLSRPDFDLVKDLTIIKKPNSEVSFKTAVLSTKVLSRLTQAFISKVSLTSEERELITNSWKGRRKMIWQHYVIGRYRALLGK